MTVDQKLDAIMLVLADIQKQLAAAPRASAPTGAVADDRDLDGEHGDFLVKKDPPRWDGASFAGCRLSECSPEFLESLAGFKDWQASKEDEKATPESQKKAGWVRRDAARARGWAARLRSGWKRPDAVPVEETGDDSVPF